MSPRMVRAGGWLRADPVRTYLTTAGVGHILVGMTWVALPSRSRELGVEWIPAVAPSLMGVLWIVSGVLALATIIGASRQVAFTAIMAWPAILGSFFLVSWILSFFPEHIAPGGSPSGVITTVSYWLFAGLHVAASLMWKHIETLDVTSRAMATFAAPREAQ